MSFTPSFKKKSPLQIVSVQTKTMLNSRLCSHSPRAQTFLLTPLLFLSCFWYAHFFSPHRKPHLFFFFFGFCFLLWAQGQRWISFWHRRTSESKQRARSLAYRWWGARGLTTAESLASARLRSTLVEVLRQHIRTASMCKVMIAFCLLQVIISTERSCIAGPHCYRWAETGDLFKLVMRLEQI